jgi:adenylate cyclase
MPAHAGPWPPDGRATMTTEEDRTPLGTDASRAQSGTPDVFISYASPDAAVADAVVGALERGGLRCWIAPRDVVPGALYADEIIRAINEAKLVVLVLSEAAAASSHVGKELERASSKHRRIVALRTDAASLPRAFEYFLSESQWIDVGAGGIEAAAAKLVDAVRRHLTPEPAAGRSDAFRRPILDRTSSQPRGRWTLFVLASTLAAALSYFALDRFWLSKRAEPQTSATARARPQSTTPEKSIAVLPFLDLSEKHDQEYFSDGMAEEVLNLLTTIPKLKVIGSTSSFQFKAKARDLREIGKQLGVVYVVTGSVRRSNDHIRVTAQLIDTGDATQRWSETYDRDASDVLKVQGEVAAGLVRALQLEVAPPILAQSRLSLRNSEAYDLYLRGLHASNRFDQRGFELAIADFRRALELDPSFAPAAEALAQTLDSMTDWGFLAPNTGWQQARTVAQGALKLNDKSAIAHAILGDVSTKYDWDWPAAARELKTAVALAPSDPTVLTYAALGRLAVGQWSEGLRLLDSASAADPLDADVHEVTGWFYVRLGRLADAESAYRRALEISPTYQWGHYYLGVALLIEGKPETALEEMKAEAEEQERLFGLALVYHALHRIKDADATLARLEASYAVNDALEIAEIYAFRGQKEQAFVWLDRAYTQKDSNLYYIKGDPLLKNVEADPRYKAFLRKMNLPD